MDRKKAEEEAKQREAEAIRAAELAAEARIMAQKKAEDEAKKRSQDIDRMLRHDDKHRKRKKTVKVLLLGQSESGTASLCGVADAPCLWEYQKGG